VAVPSQSEYCDRQHDIEPSPPRSCGDSYLAHGWVRCHFIAEGSAASAQTPDESGEEPSQRGVVGPRFGVSHDGLVSGERTGLRSALELSLRPSR
jgi:hypothetical protein